MKMLNITQLKAFALKEMPRLQTVGKLIVEEPDVMSLDEFLIKVKIWIRLAREADASSFRRT